MNQVQKDEETKRRVAATMKGTLPEAKITQPVPPPMNLVVPPSLNTNNNELSAAAAKFHGGKSTLPTTTTQKTQEEKDAETKRRVSTVMKWQADLMPKAPASPSINNNNDDRVSPRRSPPSPTTPDRLVMPITPKQNMPDSIPMHFPKSRSPTKQNANNHHRLSLTPRVNSNNTNTNLPPMVAHRRMGDTKQRVSLPPQAVSVAAAVASAAASSSVAPQQQQPLHRMGDTKHRVSLPNSSAIVTASVGSLAPRAPRNSLPNAASLAANTAPAGKRRMGDKKHGRVSLPPSAAMHAMAATAAAQATATTATINDLSPDQAAIGRAAVPQKGLRGNGGARLSMAPNTIAVAGPGAFSVPFSMVTDYTDSERNRGNGDGDEDYDNDEEEEKMEEADCNNSSTLDTDVIIGAVAATRNDPAVGTIAQKEAKLMSQAPVYDLEHGLFAEDSREGTIATTPDVAGSDTSARTREEPDRSPLFPSGKDRLRSSATKKAGSTASHDDDNDESVAKKGMFQGFFRSCFWCNILVPTLVAAGVTVGIVLLVMTFKDNGNSSSSSNTNSTISTNTTAATAAPTAVKDVWANVEVPSFTLDAWNDPASNQAKAKVWVEKDPNVGTYSDARKLQRLALVTLYYATNGIRWKKSTNWLDYNQHECLWFSAREVVADGVLDSGATMPETSTLMLQRNDDTSTSTTINTSTTTPAAKAITCNSDLEYEYLLLASDSLRGTLPAEISLLTSLVEIDLAGNTLFGSIPNQIGDSLAKLTALRLYDNQLEGTLPSLKKASDNLRQLILFNNELTGSIAPSWLGSLKLLDTLRLGGNLLSSTIPTEIAQLQQLSTLSFAGNDLTGIVPSEIGSLSKLFFLGIAENKFESTMPLELTQLSNLETFFAKQAGFISTIPSQIAKMTSLKALILGVNHFDKAIPTEIGMLTNLEGLTFSTNRLTSSIPSEIGQLTRLTLFQAFSNQLKSTLPTEIGLLTNLKELWLHKTQLTGAIPTQLAQLTALNELNIQETSLNGTFTSEICANVPKIVADCDEVTCCADIVSP